MLPQITCMGKHDHLIHLIRNVGVNFYFKFVEILVNITLMKNFVFLFYMASHSNYSVGNNRMITITRYRVFK